MVTSAAERSDIDLSLLGPLQVSVDGKEVPVGGPRQVAVLARLMLSPNQVVSMDQLVDSVWDGDEPSHPHVAVRSYVSNLRRALEPNRRRRSADSYLASSPPGYRLMVDPAVVDGVRFQRLTDAARSHLAAGDVGVAVDEVRRALGLWRGEPCSGLPASEVFVAHRVRLLGLRRAAIELLYEALLRRGDHHTVAAEIEAAIVEDPERERLTELGMLAFYRAGRQSEALALARRLRRRLRDGLGVDPSPSVDSLELKILNHDPTLDIGLVPRSIEPVGRASVAATGPGELGPNQAADPGSSSPGPEESTVPNPPSPPRRATGEVPLVGRERELGRLGAVAEALAAGRGAAATVVGHHGEGKSSLLRALARRLSGEGVSVVWARALANSTAPFWLWEQVAVAVLDELAPAARADLTEGLGMLAGLGPSAAALVPESTRLHNPPTAEITLAMTRLLERRSRLGPIAVLLENLHWADRGTATVLEYAISALCDAPVGLVAAWRPTLADSSPLDCSLRTIGSLPGVVRVDLDPFDAATVAELASWTGHRLDPEEATALHRRSGGNALLVTELIAADDDLGSHQVSGPPASVRDAVLAEVVQLGTRAPTVLRSAALFRSPFTIEDLLPLHRASGRPAGEAVAIEQVLAAALRNGLLVEVDRSAGSYRFRSTVVSEVLEAEAGPTELRNGHHIIGHHLLATDESEASYHLARSPESADRILGAQLVLDSFHRGWRSLTLADLDHRIRSGLGAAESLLRRERSTALDGLLADALGFLSWRARVDDRVTDWYDNARRSLQAARAMMADGGPVSEVDDRPDPVIDLRGAWPAPRADRPVERLERSILNLIGFPPVPAGLGDPTDFVASTGPVLDDLRVAIELLPRDSPAAVAAQVHLSVADSGPARPGRIRSSRDVQRLVAGARRRLDGPGLAQVLQVLVARCADELSPEEMRERLDEHAECQPGPTSDLLWARYGYPALLADGQVDRAARRAEAALASAEVTGDPLQRAEARLLWNRHLLWVGANDDASRSIEETGAELSALDLPEPLPLTRQRVVLALLVGEPDDGLVGSLRSTRDAGSSVERFLGGDRASPAELAFRLASAGRADRAVEHIEVMKEQAEADLLHPSDLGLLGLAAASVGDEAGARLYLRRLSEAPDRLIVRPDGSAILGPGGLWPALAGLGSERRRLELLRAALDSQVAAGGALAMVGVLAERFGFTLPIDLQANLKPVSAH